MDHLLIRPMDLLHLSVIIYTPPKPHPQKINLKNDAPAQKDDDPMKVGRSESKCCTCGTSSLQMSHSLSGSFILLSVGIREGLGNTTPSLLALLR